MLEAVMKYGVIFYAMGMIFAAGLLANVITHITARKMVREASEIQKSNHRLMRLLKAKFEHTSMVSERVQNVDVFVKKYLYEYKVLGVRLDVWRSMKGKAIWFILAFGIAGTFSSYLLEGIGEQTIRYIGFTGTFVLILYSVHIMSDEAAKLKAAKTYIVDYLENVCQHRYEKANHMQAKEEKTQVEQVKELMEESEPEKQKDSQEMRIRAILEEFLA